MSTHGLLNEVANHATYRYINGEWISFKYTKPVSRHNKANHWVDDVNQRRHAPIVLEDIWDTKWCDWTAFNLVPSPRKIWRVGITAC